MHKKTHNGKTDELMFRNVEGLHGDEGGLLKLKK